MGGQREGGYLHIGFSWLFCVFLLGLASLMSSPGGNLFGRRSRRACAGEEGSNSGERCKLGKITKKGKHEILGKENGSE